MPTESEAHAMIRSMVDQAQERARSAARMATELDALTVTGRGTDGTEVDLSQSGALKGVRIAPRLAGAAIEAIESSISRANADAQYRLQQRVRELAAEHYGDGELSQHYQEEYVRLFPSAAPADEQGGGR